MSERETSPENGIPPLYDNCNNCSEDYTLTPENTKLWMHEVTPDCNHLDMTCPHCGSKTAMFGIGDATIARAANQGIEPIVLRYPDEKLLGLRLKHLGIELVQPLALTDRHEKIIGNFALTLANTPDEYLYDLITDDGYNQPHPMRWA